MRARLAFLVGATVIAVATGSARAQDMGQPFQRLPEPPKPAPKLTKPPQIKQSVEPVYPPEARAKRLSGIVHVRALVDSRGHAIRTCPVYVPSEPQPDKSLVEAAVTNVKQWQFRSLEENPQVFRQTTVDVRLTLTTP
jgi:TonB family protein